MPRPRVGTSEDDYIKTLYTRYEIYKNHPLMPPRLHQYFKPGGEQTLKKIIHKQEVEDDSNFLEFFTLIREVPFFTNSNIITTEYNKNIMATPLHTDFLTNIFYEEYEYKFDELIDYIVKNNMIFKIYRPVILSLDVMTMANIDKYMMYKSKLYNRVLLQCFNEIFRVFYDYNMHRRIKNPYIKNQIVHMPNDKYKTLFYTLIEEWELEKYDKLWENFIKSRKVSNQISDELLLPILVIISSMHDSLLTFKKPNSVLYLEPIIKMLDSIYSIKDLNKKFIEIIFNLSTFFPEDTHKYNKNIFIKFNKIIEDIDNIYIDNKKAIEYNTILSFKDYLYEHQEHSKIIQIQDPYLIQSSSIFYKNIPYQEKVIQVLEYYQKLYKKLNPQAVNLTTEFTVFDKFMKYTNNLHKDKKIFFDIINILKSNIDAPVKQEEIIKMINIYFEADSTKQKEINDYVNDIIRKEMLISEEMIYGFALLLTLNDYENINENNFGIEFTRIFLSLYSLYYTYYYVYFMKKIADKDDDFKNYGDMFINEFDTLKDIFYNNFHKHSSIIHILYNEMKKKLQIYDIKFFKADSIFL